MKDENLYTPEEVAKRLKLSKYTIYEMIKRGDISAHRIGRSLRISDSQLENYISGTTKEENMYRCEIIEEEGSKFTFINKVRISVPSDEECGDVRICIPPQDIILSLDKFKSSARNMLPGVVSDVISDQNKAKILLDVGFPLIVLITRQSMVDLNIKKGSSLYAVFKTMSVRIIR